MLSQRRERGECAARETGFRCLFIQNSTDTGCLRGASPALGLRGLPGQAAGPSGRKKLWLRCDRDLASHDRARNVGDRGAVTASTASGPRRSRRITVVTAPAVRHGEIVATVRSGHGGHGRVTAFTASDHGGHGGHGASRRGHGGHRVGPRRPRPGHGVHGADSRWSWPFCGHGPAITAVTVAVTAVPPVTAVMGGVTVTVKGPAVAGCAGASDRTSRPIRRQGWVSCGVDGVFRCGGASGICRVSKVRKRVGEPAGARAGVTVWCRLMGRCRLLEGQRGPLGIYPGGRAGQKISVLMRHCTVWNVCPFGFCFWYPGPGIGELSLRVSLTLPISVPAWPPWPLRA